MYELNNDDVERGMDFDQFSVFSPRPEGSAIIAENHGSEKRIYNFNDCFSPHDNVDDRLDVRAPTTNTKLFVQRSTPSLFHLSPLSSLGLSTTKHINLDSKKPPHFNSIENCGSLNSVPLSKIRPSSLAKYLLDELKFSLPEAVHKISREFNLVENFDSSEGTSTTVNFRSGHKDSEISLGATAYRSLSPLSHTTGKSGRNSPQFLPPLSLRSVSGSEPSSPVRLSGISTPLQRPLSPGVNRVSCSDERTKIHSHTGSPHICSPRLVPLKTGDSSLSAPTNPNINCPKLLPLPPLILPSQCSNQSRSCCDGIVVSPDSSHDDVTTSPLREHVTAGRNQ